MIPLPERVAWHSARGRSRRVEAVCSGGPREMGRRQGEALRPAVLGAWEALSELEAFRLLQPAWMPFALYRRVSAARAGERLGSALARADPAALERVLGIAEGSRLAPRAACLLNALEAFMSSTRGKTVVPAPGACSAVALRGAGTVSGEPVIARNFDYVKAAQPFFALREARPLGGLRSLDFIAAPLAGAIDGINERGLAITYNYAYTSEAPPPAPTLSMAIAGALERFDKAEDAAGWLAGRPRWGAGILMLADASGDIVSLELAAGRHAMRRPAPGEDFLVHTNAFHMPATREVEVERQAVFTRRGPAPLRGRRVLESAELRWARLSGLVSRAGPLDDRGLAALMSDHGAAGVGGDLTPCVHGSYWTTGACLQLFPASRRMRVDFSTACQAVYDEIAL